MPIKFPWDEHKFEFAIRRKMSKSESGWFWLHHAIAICGCGGRLEFRHGSVIWVLLCRLLDGGSCWLCMENYIQGMDLATFWVLIVRVRVTMIVPRFWVPFVRVRLTMTMVSEGWLIESVTMSMARFSVVIVEWKWLWVRIEFKCLCKNESDDGCGEFSI